MWLPDFTGLPAEQAPEPLSLFIAQAWRELLSPFTPDTFRARTLDLHLLLDDLLHIAEVAQGDQRWVQYFPEVGEEIYEALQAEQRLIGLDTQLHSAISAVIETAKHKKNPLKLKRKILVAKALFGDPSRRLGSDLLTLIAPAAGAPIRKKAILFRLSTIASHVEYLGLGEESVNTIDVPLALLKPEQVVEKILAPLHSVPRDFLCAMAVDGKGSDVQSITLESPFANALRERTLPDDDVTMEWLNANIGCFVATVQTRARSARGAAESQLQTLSAVLNLHNLYTNSASFKVRPEVLVIEAGSASVVQVKPSGHFGLKPRKMARYLTRDKLRKVDGRLRGRVANALESHALALASGEPRSAIINLWTSLEAISGDGDNQAIGRRVATAIAPLIAWRRIDKIGTYLAVGLHEVLLKKKSHVNSEILSHSKLYRVSQDDVLAAICGPTGNAAIKYMFSLCDECPLLRQRLYLAWKDFSNPSTVLNQLQASRRRVDWQIQRLYRARNLLVHKGEHSHLIWRLLQNAQYYVSIAVSRVLHDLSDNRDWDVDASLEYQAMRYEHVCTILKEQGGKGLTHGDLLGTRSLVPDLPVWENVTGQALEAAD